MSDKTYVIRGYHFGYNDETFYVAGSSIHKIYHDKAEAEANYKRLEVAAARQFSLHEMSSFFDGDEDFIKKMDDFVFTRCGEHIVDEDGCVNEEELTGALNDDDTFEFINLAAMKSYQLVEFDGEPKFFAAWLPHKDSYYIKHDECSASLVCKESKEALIAKLKNIFDEFDDWHVLLHGELSDLSDTPALLEQVLNSHKKAIYNSSKKELVIKGYGEKELAALLAVNALLKTPVLEIKELTLQEVLALEQSLQSEYEYD